MKTILGFVVFLALAIGAARAGTVFVDDAGRQVTLPSETTRVLAAGPPASILLYVLAPQKMVGWVREPSAAEKEFLAAPYRDLPAHGRLTGRGGSANIEVVVALKPDLIIDVGSVDATYASLADRVQEQTGIPYVLIDGTFARTPQTLRKVAGLLGVTPRGEELAAFAERQIGLADEVLATVPPGERPSVYYGRGPDGLETGLAGSINTEILPAVGARNVAEQAGAGGIATVSVEQVLAWNPDVILASDPAFQDAVLTDPAWSATRAARGCRVFRAPNLPFGWFDAPPGVNRLIGVPWLLSVLYPEHARIDLRAQTKAYYAAFYGVEVGDGQIDRLLDGTTCRR